MSSPSAADPSTAMRPLFLDEYVDQWGDASVRMPVLETSRLNTSVSLMPGQFEMVGAITPKPNTPGPAVNRKLLVFVRADILPVPYPP